MFSISMISSASVIVGTTFKDSGIVSTEISLLTNTNDVPFAFFPSEIEINLSIFPLLRLFIEACKTIF